MRRALAILIAGTLSARGVASPEETFLRAVAEAPAVLGASALVDGARVRQDAAGLLPDPSVELMASRKRSMEERMPMWEVTVTQPLPRSGERRAEHLGAAAAAEMQEANHAMVAADIAFDLAQMLAEARAGNARALILTEWIEKARTLLSAIESRVAAGKATVADRLALEARIDAMELMRVRENQMQADARARALALLGRPVGAPLPDFASPPAFWISTEESPAAAMALSRRRDARAMEAMAKARAMPMTAVGLRFEQERARMGNNDTVGVVVMTDLPWRGRRAGNAEAKAARALERSAEHEMNQASARVESVRARIEATREWAREVDSVAARTEKRAEALLEAVLRTSGVGAAGMGSDSSLLMVLEVLEQGASARLQRVDAELAVKRTLAELWLHVPVKYYSARPQSEP